MRIHKKSIDATDIIFDDGIRYWGQYLLPVIFLGISVLIYIRSNEEKKSFALVCLVIGIIGALLYYLCGFIHV